jgi:hypothetical protein
MLRKLLRTPPRQKAKSLAKRSFERAMAQAGFLLTLTGDHIPRVRGGVQLPTLGMTGLGNI